MTGSDVLLQRMMTLHPKVIDLKLDRMWRILERLGHPERRLPPVIHVAGTNGKGSTVAMLRAGLEAGGARCHVYTSPHLVRFHERIRLAGQLIGEDALTALLDRCLAANGPEPITYFEITTAAALLAFAETPADWVLLEVGLGGRLDATNVVERPRLTVITPVSMDHQAFLGDTVTAIAGEKAGILKRGVPCIVGPQDDDAQEVIEARAARLGAPLRLHRENWCAWEEHGRLIYQDEHGLRDLPLPLLRGPHQIDNAGIALAALREIAAPERALEGAVTKVDWPARMQPLRHTAWNAQRPDCEIWLDGGHNPAAGLALSNALKAMGRRPTHLICAMMGKKDVAGYLRPLATQAQHLTALPVPGQAGSEPAEAVESCAKDLGFSTARAGSVSEALAGAEPDSRVVICGSLFLAGDVLARAE